MNATTRRIRTVLVLVLGLAATTASAQTGINAQTWVSGYGNDIGICSFAAPCRTFTYALTQTAVGGEISILDPGPFGPATITRGVTISGTGAYGSVLVPAGVGAGVWVSTTQATDIVTLRGLSITAGGVAAAAAHGIFSDSAAGTLHVDNCQIFGLTANGILSQTTGDTRLYVSNTTIRGTTGIYVKPSGATATAWVSIYNTKLENNVRGIRAEDGSIVMIRNTVATGNTSNGFIGAGNSRPVKMTIENSVASFNGTGAGAGVYANNLATIWVSNSTIMGNNAYGLYAATGGTIFTYVNNRIMANTLNDSLASGGTISTVAAQ